MARDVSRSSQSPQSETTIASTSADRRVVAQLVAGEVPVRRRTDIVDDTAERGFLGQRRTHLRLFHVRDRPLYGGVEIVEVVPLPTREVVAYLALARSLYGVERTPADGFANAGVLRVVVRIDPVRDRLIRIIVDLYRIDRTPWCGRPGKRLQ
ncbi:hypothetical protein GOC74_08615 [Halomicrobium mukohataei]|uniref:Uncharacterized protein n=1 Tax=Halomicrobium mukohataei TaxID=57705 RepID=A0A847UFR6_9EURY|nr:hypothetical protein [Halomicrobium mukohataei]NLV09991.1 hypothetical protein [Halomicrobium mukohataei]